MNDISVYKFVSDFLTSLVCFKTKTPKKSLLLCTEKIIFQQKVSLLGMTPYSANAYHIYPVLFFFHSMFYFVIKKYHKSLQLNWIPHSCQMQRLPNYEHKKCIHNFIYNKRLFVKLPKTDYITLYLL